MNVFNIHPFLMGKDGSNRWPAIFLWLQETIGPVTFRSHDPNDRIMKNRFSHDFRLRGDGWQYQYLITCNNQDQYPAEWADTWFHSVAGTVYEYKLLTINDDAQAVQFKLTFGNGN